MQHQPSAKKKFVELSNCLRLHNGSAIFDRIDVLRAIKASNFLKPENIDTVSQIFNNKNWFISIKTEVDASSFVGKSIKIKDVDYILHDANQKINKEQQFKVLWLPHNYDKNKIKRFFNDANYDVNNIEDELVKEEGFESIKTGNYLVKAILKDGNDKQERWLTTGNYEINGLRVFLIRKGDKPKCFLCNQTGHKKAECPKKVLKCDKCRKVGHTSIECTFAKRLELDKNDLPDITIEDSEMEDEQNGKTNSNETDKKRKFNQTPEKGTDISNHNKENIDVTKIQSQKKKNKTEQNKTEQNKTLFDKVQIQELIKNGNIDKAMQKLPQNKQEQLQTLLKSMENDNEKIFDDDDF